MRYMNDIIGMAMMRGVNWGVCKPYRPCYNAHAENPYETPASSGDIFKTLSYKVGGYPDVIIHRTDKRRAWIVLVTMAAFFRFTGLYFVQKNLIP